MEKTVYPYIPNSAPGRREELLEAVGLESVEDIFGEIPDHLRYGQELDIPEALLSEFELRKHVEDLLARNKSTSQLLSFLGGGVWNHYVPAVCNTIGSRDEFLTTYQRGAYADHGKMQALFETSSMIADLVKLDAVTSPTYDWANAAAIAIRMACRMTGRKKVLISGTISPTRLKVIENYLKPDIKIELIDFEIKTGQLELLDLDNKLCDQVATVYFENPSFLGFIEESGGQISDLAHKSGAEVIVGVDPTSLGILSAPPDYGADIVCGDLQPFGLHQQWGGGLAGFIASPDTEKYIAEYPTLLYGVAKTVKDDQYGFGKVAFERTSYVKREEGKDFIGTSTALYGIIAGVYLALMGPEGIRELGMGIIQKAAYARKKLAEINGVNPFKIDSVSFKEFVVEFEQKYSVKKINQKLLARDIFGGLDLTEYYNEYENSALFSITEVHSKSDIDCLAAALEEIIQEGE